MKPHIAFHRGLWEMRYRCKTTGVPMVGRVYVGTLKDALPYFKELCEKIRAL